VDDALAPTSQRRAMSRDDAKQQVAELLEGRRGAASMHYGPCRAKLTDEKIDEAKRAEFMRR